jgi:hypothetical protein
MQIDRLIAGLFGTGWVRIKHTWWAVLRWKRWQSA